MIELPRTHLPRSKNLEIKIFGLGGAGANALDRMQLDGIDGVELVAINTDAQSLASSVAPHKIQIGAGITRGLGAGGDPEVGEQALQESAGELRAALEGVEVVFLCVGLGGGTGSGAAPQLAALAREQNAVVVIFATMPFSFEGRRRMAQADEALAALQRHADVVICFENNKMADAVSPTAAIQEAFAAADQTISQSARAIASMLRRRGLIHLGLDEVATALRRQNPRCLFGYGEAEGDNRAHQALERALKSPLMDRGHMLSEAQSVMVNVAGGSNLTLNEVQILMEEFNRHISDHTRILFGTAVDPKLGQRLCVTILSSVEADPNGLGQRPATESAPSRREIVQPVPEVVSLPRTARVTPAVIAQPVELPMAEIAPEPEPELPSYEAAPEPVLLPNVAAPAQPVRVLATRTRPAATDPATPKREIKQEQMQFEPVTRGRFEKSEPTIVDGQDLDVPTFLRRNVRSR